VAPPTFAARDAFGGLLLAVVAAVAQPVLDLLAGDLAFFTAHQALPGDVVALAVLLVVVVPLLVAAPVAGLVRLLPAVGVPLFAVLIGLLAASVGQRALERVATLPTWALLTAAAAGGIAVAVACVRADALRTLLRWGVVVPLAVLGLFLFASPASRLVFPPAAASEAEEGTVGNPAPVVVLVLDELPIVSLLDAEGRIDAGRFPGFARLAAQATWYRNAATPNQNTDQVLPVVLSGGALRTGVEPSWTGYPDNLFSLVGEGYDVWAHEEATWLCGPDICDDRADERQDARTRWSRLLLDTGVVAAHVASPRPLRATLPPIDTAWSGFADAGGGSAAAAEEEEEVTFDDFLASFDTWGPGALRYFHLMAPHHPWRFLPDGVQYPADVGIPREGIRWGSDEVAVVHAQQRHLLQTGYADHLLGQLLDRLEASSHYDDALVVVMADHGIAFEPEQTYRGVTPATALEVGFVPLFVKYPGQQEGRVDERPASLHDVLPTIADVLDARAAWPMQGQSLLAEDPAAERERTVVGLETVALPSNPDFGPLLARNAERFGNGDWAGVYRVGPYADLVGTDVAVRAGAADAGAVTLVDRSRYDRVDLDSGGLPALVRGTLQGVEPGTWIAIGLNGTVATTTRVQDGGADGPTFSALALPELFRDGRNAVTVHRIEEAAGGVVLHEIPLRP